MPTDNPAPIAPGAAVAFPQSSVTSGTILPSSDTEFALTEVGTYLITFTATAAETGQLVLALNGAEIPYTLVGRDATNSQISGMALITTTLATDLLTVQNPASATTSLTLTPSAGGTDPVSAHLTILQIA